MLKKSSDTLESEWEFTFLKGDGVKPDTKTGNDGLENNRIMNTKPGDGRTIGHCSPFVEC